MYLFIFRKISKLTIDLSKVSILVICLFLYFTYLLLNNSGMVDLYVFEGIEVPTMVILTIVILLAWGLFMKLSSALLFCYVVLVSFVVFIPPLKYFNSLGLYGVWDSLMHYSFSLWIVENGFVPREKLTYIFAYGNHPGNGLIPAFISSITSVPLGFSMNLALFISYLTYLIIVVFYI